MITETAVHGVVSRTADPIREASVRRPAWPAGAALVLAAGAWAAWSWQPPSALGPAAPAAGFSAGRAAAHVEVIASAPRPMGSPQWTRARQYVLDQLAVQGLAARVQSATVVSGAQVAYVQNVVATVPGREHGPGVLLSAHYDSVANSRGASDDGAGVAALLEIARALQAGPALRRPVTLLFTDGEETGLSGAEAFAAAVPLPSVAALAINLDARGSRGPALMFQTGANTGPLMPRFAAAVSRPFAASLMAQLYELIDNDTDFSVFKRAGIPGFNFALVDGVLAYHTAVDLPGNLDPRSLQHLGSSALELTRNFSEQPPSVVAGPERAYFNVGSWLVTYPETWAVPLSAATVLLLLVAAFAAVRIHRATVRGLLLGIAAFLLVAVAAAILTGIAWELLRYVHGSYRALPYGETYNGVLYRIALSALYVAIAAAAYGWLLRRARVETLWGAVLIATALLALGLAVVAPRVSYLLTWPALAGAAGWLVLAKTGTDLRSGAGLLAAAPCALASTLILLPVVSLLFWVFSLGFLFPAVLVLGMMFGLVLPAVEGVRAWNRSAPAAAALACCVVFLVAGAVTSLPSASTPLPSHLSYLADGQLRTAAWTTTAARLDAWQAGLMGPSRSQPCDVFVSAGTRPCFVGVAADAGLDPPRVDLLENRIESGTRLMRLRLQSPRGAALMVLVFDRPAELVVPAPATGLSAKSGRSVPADNATFRFVAPPREGVEIVVRLQGTGPSEVRVADRSDGLAALPGFVPRPADRIPGGRDSDAVLVTARMRL
jgi:hypothetical protein